MDKPNKTGEGDIVLIYFKDKPTLYARIEFIESDFKKDWYQVTLQLLSVPPQTVTWILREEYIAGAPFTMGGDPVRLEKIARLSPKDQHEDPRSLPNKKGREKPAKVIPFKIDQ